MFEINRRVEESAPKLFGKTVEDVEKEINNLREWMESKSDIFPEIMNDNMLRNFIIINKFNMGKARNHIENYYLVRVKYPEFYIKSNPKLDSMKLYSEMLYVTILPQLTENMERVTIIKLANLDLAHQYHAIDFLAYSLNLVELRLQVDYMVNNIIILDQKDLPLSMVLKTTPNASYKGLNILEKVYSFRISKIIFINVPSYAYCLLTMLKRLMKAKLYERIQVCTDVSKIYEAFPKSMLPSDYGGEEKSLKELTKMTVELLTAKQERFDRLDEIQEHLMQLNSNEKNHQYCTLS